jgi:asparagine synthase (glutamine-hydrolysing)
VIVHAWEAWGERCVDRLRGMFAFVLYDRNRETLFMARDRLGVKPLFYSLLADGTLAFGSELKSLLVLPGLSRQIDPCAVEEYFALGYVAEPRTILAGTRKLPPGHMLTIRRGQPVPEPVEYWDVRFTLDRAITAEEACAELERRLEESVRLRMISEVPLGAFLSGGVDSSAVVATMARISDDPVNTCSISFDDPAFDEARFAQQVADRYGTRHFVDRVASDDFDLIDELAKVYDEPYADSSAIPTYRVCQLARKHVTVALSGDGGDESFAGYRRYRMHMMEERLRSVLPLGVRRPVFGLLGRAYPKANWAPRMFRAKTTFESLARTSVEAYLHSVSIIREPVRNSLFSASFRGTLGGYRAAEVFNRHASRAGTDDPLALVQYLDLKTYLVGDINTKVDRASMAHSLEVREPLMDHPLVEWLASLPNSLKVQGQEGKWLLKKAMEPRLPHEILYRPKMGFAVPLARWFRGPLRQRVRDCLMGEVLADTGMFDRKVLQQLVDAHQTGGMDHSAPLWTLMMFEAFLRNVHGETGRSVRLTG